MDNNEYRKYYDPETINKDIKNFILKIDSLAEEVDKAVEDHLDVKHAEAICKYLDEKAKENDKDVEYLATKVRYNLFNILGISLNDISAILHAMCIILIDIGDAYEKGEVHDWITGNAQKNVLSYKLMTMLKEFCGITESVFKEVEGDGQK